MANLTSDEIEEFLSQPRTAHLVTLRAEGTPHVAPVWFLWDEGRALVMADAKAVKVRNIRRNPAVALSVSTPGHPYSFVTIEGVANLADDGLEDMVRRTCILYEGDERGSRVRTGTADRGTHGTDSDHTRPIHLVEGRRLVLSQTWS